MHPSRHRAQSLAAHAARMRHAPTLSEAVLWQALRGGQLGVQFRRQVVIGPYIADFCAPAARLVVEVDGGYHAERQQQDQRRQERLERAGYTVVRVTHAEVLGELGAVLGRLRAALGREST